MYNEFHELQFAIDVRFIFVGWMLLDRQFYNRIDCTNITRISNKFILLKDYELLVLNICKCVMQSDENIILLIKNDSLEDKMNFYNNIEGKKKFRSNGWHWIVLLSVNLCRAWMV